MLKGYPAKYIYEPWTAPESVQRAAKCIIGKDYPVPMVNHAEVSKLNTGRMKQVYQQLAVYASIGNCLIVDRQTDSRYVLILETIYLLHGSDLSYLSNSSKLETTGVLSIFFYSLITSLFVDFVRF